MWPSTAWSIQRYHFYRRHKFAGSPRDPESVGARILGNEAAAFATVALVFVIYGRTRRRSSATCEIGDTERKIHERNFYRHTDILTLLPVVARATHRNVWALFYDGKPSNADRFTRKRLFAPFRRACGRPIRRRNNEMGRRSLPGFSVRKPPAWRIMAARLLYRRLRRQYVLAVSADPSRRGGRLIFN